MSEWNGSYLVQRLLVPTPENQEKSLEAFGAGHKKGGFDNKTWDELMQIFAFERMGAGEFEFSAEPYAFEKFKKENLVKFTHTINDRNVFVICPKDIKENVIKNLNYHIEHECNGKRLSYFKERLLSTNPPTDFKQLVGWFNVSTGFFYFIDEDMFNKMCNYLKI